MADKGKRPIKQEGSDVLAKAILNDLENTEHGFFNNFLRLNGIDVQNPGQVQAVMSNRAGGLKITNSGRIASGRLSSLRSKKKNSKMYETMLRRKLDNLKATSSALSAQLELAQKTADALKDERVELRSQMESIRHKVQLRESLNKEMSNEIEQLRFLIGRLPPSMDSDEFAATASDTNTQLSKKSD